MSQSFQIRPKAAQTWELRSSLASNRRPVQHASRCSSFTDVNVSAPRCISVLSPPPANQPPGISVLTSNTPPLPSPSPRLKQIIRRGKHHRIQLVNTPPSYVSALTFVTVIRLALILPGLTQAAATVITKTCVLMVSYKYVTDG